MNSIKTNILFSEIQIGGYAEDLKIKYGVKNHRFLKAENGLRFKLNDKKNTKKHNNLYYLNNGTYTLVFGIDYVDYVGSGINPKNWNDMYNDKLILRVTTESSVDLVEKHYNSDRQIFGNNMIDIFMYGYFDMPGTHYYNFYTITREYSTDFSSLNFENKLKFTIDYFKVLEIADSNQIFYRDSKITNVGYDLTKDDCRCIIIDYDAKTFIKYDKIISLGHKYGTYPPFYMYYVTATINPTDLSSRYPIFYNKFFVAGMINILDMLFIHSIINNDLILLIDNIYDLYKHYKYNPSSYSKLNLYNDILTKRTTYEKSIEKYIQKNNEIKISDITLNNVEEKIKNFCIVIIINIIKKSIRRNYNDVLTIAELTEKRKCLEFLLNLLIKINKIKN